MVRVLLAGQHGKEYEGPRVTDENRSNTINTAVLISHSSYGCRNQNVVAGAGGVADKLKPLAATSPSLRSTG